MVIKYGVLEPEEIAMLKEYHKELLSDIPFRKTLVNEYMEDYYNIARRINYPLPSRKPAEEVKKNMLLILNELYDTIQKNVQIISASIDNLNFYADKLNSIGLTKTVRGKQIPYEKLSKEKYLKNEETVVVKSKGKDPKTGNIVEIKREIVYNNAGIPTPEDLISNNDGAQRLDEVAKVGKESFRIRKSGAKRGRPAKRTTGNAPTEKDFGKRIIKNATKIAGTNKTMNKFKI